MNRNANSLERQDDSRFAHKSGGLILVIIACFVGVVYLSYSILSEFRQPLRQDREGSRVVNGSRSPSLAREEPSLSVGTRVYEGPQPSLMVTPPSDEGLEDSSYWETEDSPVPEQADAVPRNFSDLESAASIRDSYPEEMPAYVVEAVVQNNGMIPTDSAGNYPVQPVAYLAPQQAGGSAPAPASNSPGSANSAPAQGGAASNAPAPAAAEPDEFGKGTYLKELGAWLGQTITPVLEGGVYGGWEYNLLRTETAGSGSLRFTDLTTNKFSGADTESEFGSGFRWTVGMHHQLVGFRARYFDFREQSFELGAYLPNSDWPRLESSQRLDLSALDIELTQNYSFLGSALQSSFGVRHASLEATNSILGIGSLGESLEVHGASYVFRSIEAIGPTFSIGGRSALPWGWGATVPLQDHHCSQSLCYCGSGWSWFWSMRGSFLWGDSLAKASTEAQTYVKYNDSIQGVARSSDSSIANLEAEAKLFHTELLLGLEYRHQLQILPAIMSFRTALEYQGWDTGSPVAESRSFAFLASNEPRFGGRVESYAIADNRHFNLMGLNLSVTFNY